MVARRHDEEKIMDSLETPDFPVSCDFLMAIIMLVFIIYAALSHTFGFKKITFICGELFVLCGIVYFLKYLWCIFIDTYSINHRDIHRIATNDKKFFIQYREKRFVFFGKKIWKDKKTVDNVVLEFENLECARLELEKLVSEDQEYKFNNNTRKHVEVEINYKGTKIQC